MSEAIETEATPEPKATSLEDRVKQTAAEQGWREDGDLDAFEFIARGSQFHKDLKHRVDALAEDNRKAYQVIAEHISNQKTKEYKQEVAAVKRSIKEAAAEGDAEKVLELTDTLKSIPEPDPIVEDPKLKAVDEWAGRNEWFTKNEDMRYDALGFYQAEKVRLGTDDPEKILPKVEDRIKKMYPDYFTPVNPNRSRPSGDTGGKMKKDKNVFSKDDLDEDERRHFDQFVASGLKEKDLLAAVQEQRKRRGV